MNHPEAPMPSGRPKFVRTTEMLQGWLPEPLQPGAVALNIPSMQQTEASVMKNTTKTNLREGHPFLAGVKQRERELLILVRNKPMQKLDADDLIEWLRKGGILGASTICSNHIKIGRLNYYLSTGVLHFDNEPRLPERGPRALKVTLEQLLKRDLPEFD